MVAQLQEWLRDCFWNEASEVTEAVIETISSPYAPLLSSFDVYAKALQQFFRGHELTATEWDETRSDGCSAQTRSLSEGAHIGRS